MTILITFHRSDFRTFKHFYLMLRERHRAEFPNLVSYQRFVELMPSVLVLLCAYLQSRFGPCTEIGFIDSTALAVCANKRIRRNRVFWELAKLEKQPRVVPSKDPLSETIWRSAGFIRVASSEHRSGRRRNRDPPAASLTPNEPNNHLNSTGFDDPFLAFGVPVDAVARHDPHMGSITGRVLVDLLWNIP